MADINPKFRGHQITGNLATDPELVTTGNNKQLVRFRVAENHRARNRDTGEWQDVGSTFYDVAISVGNRENLARNVLTSLQTGHRVTVTGTYDASPYVTSSGEAGMNYRIIADDVAASLSFNQVRIGPNASASAQASASATAQQEASNSPADPWADTAPDTDFNASM